MNNTGSFLVQNKDKNGVSSEKIKTANFVSYSTSQRLFSDITVENYLAMKFVHTEFSVSTLLYSYLLAEQLYYIFWIVIIIISYSVLFIMSTNTNTKTRSENGAPSRQGRLRLWNPRLSDDSDNDIQPPQVVDEQSLNDEVDLPEDRPQVNINNAIRDEDLPQCRPLSECHDNHPADPVIYDLKDHGHNYRQRIFYEKWSEQEAKVFSNKYVNLQSNKERKFDLMAKALPDKTSADCRQFYYLYKHILDFKTPERERKQIEKERKESLLRLKEPCSSRLRSRRSHESHAKPRDAATPSKNYIIVKSTQTNRPVFARNGEKTQEENTELTKELQITEENITAPSPSIQFTAPLQENDLSNLSNLSNLNLLADVCCKNPQVQMLSKLGQKQEKQQKERKRSHDERQIYQNSSSEKDYTSKKRCLNNIVKQVNSTAKVVKVQEKFTAKENGKKRKRQEVRVNEMVAGQKKTRAGRAIKTPTKMDL